MKLAICSICDQVFSFPSDGSWGNCACGNVQIRWSDAQKGLVKVKASNPDLVRIMGIHNQFLREAIADLSNLGWRAVTKDICENQSEGYLFDKNRRNCPVVIVRVGETDDISWED